MKKLAAFYLVLGLAISSSFASDADEVFAALAAENDNQARLILQDLASSADFDELDAIHERDPSLFGSKYFPSEFMETIIFDSPRANEILDYLFRAGVPLPRTLPSPLPLIQWKIMVDTFRLFHSTTHLDKKTAFETETEYSSRLAGWNRLVDKLLCDDLVVPANLELGTYNFQKGYFQLALHLTVPDDDPGYRGIIKVCDTSSADIRYYIDKRAAAFFKDRLFGEWTATVLLTATDRGAYEPRELRVDNGKVAGLERLWAFRIIPLDGQKTGERVAKVENYLKDKVLTANGKEVPGAGKIVIATPSDSIVIIATAPNGPGILYKGDVHELAQVKGGGIVKIAAKLPLPAAGPTPASTLTQALPARN